MNQKTIIKVMLDLVMAVLFITLLGIHWTGLIYHEIVGLVIFGILAAHILLNWSRVKNLTKNFFNSRLKLKAKLIYILNAVLLVSVAAITLTGIMISEVIFGFGFSGRQELLYTVHKWMSYGCLGLFGVHIALHWRYLLASLRIMLTNPAGNILIRSFKSFGAAALIIVILYKLVVPNLDSVLIQTKVSTPASKSSSADSNASYSSEISTSKSSSTEINSSTTYSETVTLSQYLGSLFCTACHKRCPLSNPQCGKADSQIETAKINYQQLYGSSVTLD